MLVGIIVPVIILSIILFTLLFLLWRRKRRRDASRPAPGFAVAAATPIPFPEHFSDTDTLSVLPAMSPIDAKRAHHAASPSVSESESSMLSAGSPAAVSPVEMAELTAAMQRAGLSVNELMSSLNRVSRLDPHTAGEAMPPRYEA